MFTEATVSIIGNIGSIETRGEDGKVLALSVATNQSYTDSDGKKVENTHWINCVGFKKNVVSFGSKYLAKGRYVRINGTLRTNEWTDKHDQKRRDLEVLIDEIGPLDKKPDTEGE